MTPSPAGRERPGRLGAAFWTLIATILVHRLGTMVGPFLALYLLRERRLEPATVAGLLGLGSAMAMLSSPVGGWAADRFGRRGCLVAGMLGSAAGMLAIPHAPSVAWLGAAMALRSFMHELVRPASNAAVADLVPPEHRAYAFGIFRTVANLGFGAGTFLGGRLAGVSFLLLFAVNAASAGLAALLVVLFVPETRPSAPAKGHGGDEAPGADAAPPRARFGAFCLLALVVTFVSSQLSSTLPMSLERRGGGAAVEELFGSLLALNAVLVVVAQVPLSRLSARVRPTTGLALGAALYGAGYGLVALPLTPLLLAAAVGVFTAGEMLFFPLAATYTAQLAPTLERGRWFGVLTMAFGAGTVLSPLVGTWVLTQHGDVALWALSPPLGLLAAAGLLALGVGDPPSAGRPAAAEG